MVVLTGARQTSQCRVLFKSIPALVGMVDLTVHPIPQVWAVLVAAYQDSSLIVVKGFAAQHPLFIRGIGIQLPVQVNLVLDIITERT